MLDQNTDRNIWMIGAVLVGVVMIIAAKGGFSAIFKKVVDFFTKTIDGATANTDFGKTTGTVASHSGTILASIDWGMIAQHASTILIH